MEEVLHANIFFIIASIGTVLLFVLMAIVLFYVIKILKKILRLIERVEAGSEQIAADLSYFRTQVTEGGFFSRILSWILASSLHFGGKKSRKE